MNTTENRNTKGNGTFLINDTTDRTNFNAFGFRATKDTIFKTLVITDGNGVPEETPGAILGIVVEGGSPTTVKAEMGEMVVPLGYTIKEVKLASGVIILF